MVPGDWVAIYGAFLATVLAAFQVRDWKEKRRLFVVKTLGGFSKRSPQQAEFIITNQSTLPLEIHFIGVCISYRKWTSPWRVTDEYVYALQVISGGYLNQKTLNGPIASGAICEGYINRKKSEEMLADMMRCNGFFFRPILWIDHSASTQPFRKSLKWMA